MKVTFGETTKTIWFVTDPDIPFVDHNRGDIWLPPLLILAMRRGGRLRLADPISAGRRADLRKVQDIFTTWYPKRMTRVKVVAPDPESPSGPTSLLRRKRDVPDTRVTASCFTGGVDSFNTLVKHKKTLGALVYGFGIDIPKHETEAAERVGKQLAQVAEDGGLRLLSAETNIRRFMGHDVSWGFESHGAVLVSLGTIFSSVISTLYIPSTHSYAVPFPWGSHPLVDGLWSTRRLKVEHDGAESGRSQKIQRIADDSTAQRNLRVCYKEFSDTNCGRCMKCTRTMMALALLGRLDKFETFATPLDLDHVRTQKLTTENDLFQYTNLQAMAAGIPGHEGIKDVVDSLLPASGAPRSRSEQLAAGRRGRPLAPVQRHVMSLSTTLSFSLRTSTEEMSARSDAVAALMRVVVPGIARQVPTRSMPPSRVRTTSTYVAVGGGS